MSGRVNFDLQLLYLSIGVIEWPVTRYLVRVHKWSGRTSYDSINGPGGPFMFVISGPLET